jgi:hypothetical protein
MTSKKCFARRQQTTGDNKFSDNFSISNSRRMTTINNFIRIDLGWVFVFNIDAINFVRENCRLSVQEDLPLIPLLACQSVHKVAITTFNWPQEINEFLNF